MYTLLTTLGVQKPVVDTVSWQPATQSLVPAPQSSHPDPRSFCDFEKLPSLQVAFHETIKAQYGLCWSLDWNKLPFIFYCPVGGYSLHVGTGPKTLKTRARQSKNQCPQKDHCHPRTLRRLMAGLCVGPALFSVSEYSKRTRTCLISLPMNQSPYFPCSPSGFSSDHCLFLLRQGCSMPKAPGGTTDGL